MSKKGIRGCPDAMFYQIGMHKNKTMTGVDFVGDKRTLKFMNSGKMVVLYDNDDKKMMYIKPKELEAAYFKVKSLGWLNEQS